jgi:hypothetical protein
MVFRKGGERSHAVAAFLAVIDEDKKKTGRPVAVAAEA